MEQVRTASSTWSGDLLTGSGMINDVTSGSFARLPVSWAARTEGHDVQTSPEELLAAAHGGCFTMSLTSELTKAGTPPERLDVRCTITMDEVEGKGHQFVELHPVLPPQEEPELAEFLRSWKPRHPSAPRANAAAEEETG